MRPDCHRSMGGRFVVFFSFLKLLGTFLCFQYYCKSSRHRTPGGGCENIYPAFAHTIFVVERHALLRNNMSLIQTWTDQGINYVYACRTFVSVPRCTLPDRCTSEAQCSSAQSLSVNVSLFIQNKYNYIYFFVGCDLQLYTVDGVDHVIWCFAIYFHGSFHQLPRKLVESSMKVNLLQWELVEVSMD